ncbi:MAG TPA: ABC transporter permease [Phycisphaerae bacterium]|nr:ABC transporter permease [Phycisphaerae bacterium]
MIRFLAWRLVQSVVVMWVVYTLTFFLLMAAPGDPFLGTQKNPPAFVREALAKNYGLEYLKFTAEERAKMPAGERAGYVMKAYWLYLGRVVRGDLGPSVRYPDWSVTQVIAHSLPISVALGSAALLISLWGGAAAGTAAAVWKNRWPDVLLAMGTLVGVSLPSFVVGALLLMALVVAVPLLPSGGWGSVRQLILPAVTLSLFYMAYVASLARSSTLEVLHADFVRTARAKGLSGRQVIVRHVGSNAALPLLSYMGPAAATVLTGSFVVEKLFAIPGLGTHFVNGCLNDDIPLVLGATLVYTAIVVVFNLLVDVAYAAVDPRITLG